MKQKRILRKHQKSKIPFLLSVKYPALYWKMGLGKTLMIIRICKLYADCKTFLVVAPFSALLTWEDELKFENIQYTKLFGTRAERLKKLKTLSTPWALINYEGHRVIPEVAGKKWDVVIVDESIRISNKCQTTKFFCDHFRTAKHRWVACGTPAAENELQYYFQLKFLSSDYLKEKSWYEFRHRNFKLVGNFKWKITNQGRKYLFNQLNKISTFLTLKDVSSLKFTYEKRLVDLPEKLRIAYDRLENEYYFELQGRGHSTIYATQKYTWLRKICCGYSDNLRIKSHHKTEEIVNLLTTELKDQQILIWCRYVDDIQEVSTFLNSNKIKSDMIYGKIKEDKRKNIVNSFESGKLQTIVMQPGSMMYGTRFHADAIVYFSTPESANQREQSECRTVWLDKENNILIIDLQCYNTLEEVILENCFNKIDNSQYTMNILNYLQRKNNAK